MRNYLSRLTGQLTTAALIFGLLVLVPAPVAQAQSVETRPDGSMTWEEKPDGTKIDFDSSGKVLRIYSKYTHPVTIPDRRGIHTAQVIAEEKAKAEIIRFMEQQVTTGRVVGEVDSTLSQASREKKDGVENISKVDKRTVSESLAEVTSSSAAGTLRGVVVLESGYDDKTEEAWVMVGISQKTMGAAQATKAMTDAAATKPQPETMTGAKASAASPIPSHVKHSDQDF